MALPSHDVTATDVVLRGHKDAAAQATSVVSLEDPANRLRACPSEGADVLVGAWLPWQWSFLDLSKQRYELVELGPLLRCVARSNGF